MYRLNHRFGIRMTAQADSRLIQNCINHRKRLERKPIFHTVVLTRASVFLKTRLSESNLWRKQEENATPKYLLENKRIMSHRNIYWKTGGECHSEIFTGKQEENATPKHLLENRERISHQHIYWETGGECHSETFTGKQEENVTPKYLLEKGRHCHTEIFTGKQGDNVTPKYLLENRETMSH
ncbi:hypothetical protein PoB_003414300 [Plakobranchus ocellatus]|uniref:Uncharacterized protein n=1 Tax=Plakobranchus ocellatus TaxID=259542 RepID=A0AAV4ALE7_9GAST|nr:hypothetical protein PoB_003414300 [Plakobranchus ocellatus]